MKLDSLGMRDAGDITTNNNFSADNPTNDTNSNGDDSSLDNGIGRAGSGR